MNKFTKFALAATVATYFLIFVGGLVRVSGAGMGCPDWPTCFGRWIPPTSISQLPANIDPAQFNFALAWIEYVNRLIGMTVGILIAITAIWSLLSYRKYLRIVIPALLAALLVAYQGWQGSRLVATQLDPMIVSIHMGLAFIIAGLMMYVTQQTFYLNRDVIKIIDRREGGLHWWIIVLAITSLIQVISGTQIREAMEAAIASFPLLNEAEIMTRVGWVQYFHTILGILVVLITWQTGTRILRQTKGKSAMISQITIAAIITVTLQLIVGPLTILFTTVKIAQLFHLLLSALHFGFVILIFSALRIEGRSV
ncbi:MAG: COX15/CtaA family protein [Candidatus Zixiibacteriota bacterium]